MKRARLATLLCFRRDRRGVAIVEFAMVLPAMLVLYFGVVEVSQGVMISRKVAQLNRALADLTSQAGAVTTADLTNIFEAAQTIMLPFPGAPAMTVSSVVINKSGTASICWSEVRNGATAASGAVDLSAALRAPNTSLVMARVSYEFEPTIGYLITGKIKIGGAPIYMRPRGGKAGGADNIEQVERVGRPLCPA